MHNMNIDVNYCGLVYIVCIHNIVLNVFGVESKVSGVAHNMYNDISTHLK